MLEDYTHRFKTAQDIMISHMGEFQIPKLTEADKDWGDNDDDKQKKCHKAVYDKFITYMYTENADRN